MTFKDWIDTEGGDLAVLTESHIVLPAWYPFELDELLTLRYGDRECYTDNVATFTDAYRMICGTKIPFYAPLINNLSTLIDNMVNAETTDITTAYRAPAGDVDESYTNGMTTFKRRDSKAFDSDRIEKLKSSLSDMVTDLIGEFEVLFKGGWIV